MRLVVFRHPHEPDTTRRTGLVVGTYGAWWIHPFRAGTELTSLLAASLEQRENAADRAAQSDGIPAAQVVVLAPARVRSTAVSGPAGPGDPIATTGEVPRLRLSTLLAAVVSRDVPVRTRARAGAVIGGYCLANVWIPDRPDPRPPPDPVLSVGPWVVTADQFGPDGPPRLAVTTRVNGDRAGPHELDPVLDRLVHHAARSGTLRAGDLLVPPPRPDPVGVRAGDLVETAAEHLGTLHNRVIGPTGRVPVSPFAALPPPNRSLL